MKNNIFKRNCCDGIYNSFDVHFTSVCDNKCSHCIDAKYNGIGKDKPDWLAISRTIMLNKKGYDDVLFLGGEPCLYIDELLYCIQRIKDNTALKVYITTAIPKICSDRYETFKEILKLVNGINLSVQHYDENVADKIRRTNSKFDRQAFYESLPYKEKIRINLNIVKPYLYTNNDIMSCIHHYDKMGFNEIKISEIQHGTDCFVSFEDIFNINLGSPFYSGCQTYFKANALFPDIKTPILLKRSCFMCEDTLKASFMDGIKAVYQTFNKPKNKYSVVYEDGRLSNGWI